MESENHSSSRPSVSSALQTLTLSSLLTAGLGWTGGYVYGALRTTAPLGTAVSVSLNWLLLSLPFYSTYSFQIVLFFLISWPRERDSSLPIGTDRRAGGGPGLPVARP